MSEITPLCPIAFLHTFKSNFELHGFASLLTTSRVWAPDSGFLAPSRGEGKPELRIRAFADLKGARDGSVERKVREGGG